MLGFEPTALHVPDLYLVLQAATLYYQNKDEKSNVIKPKSSCIHFWHWNSLKNPAIPILILISFRTLQIKEVIKYPGPR